MTTVKNLGYLEDSEVTAEEWLENNCKARSAASEILNFNDKGYKFFYNLILLL